MTLKKVRKLKEKIGKMLDEGTLLIEKKKKKNVEYSLEDYKNAASGYGPLADTWKDKPHRLVYDLVKMVKKLKKKNATKL